MLKLKSTNFKDFKSVEEFFWLFKNLEEEFNILEKPIFNAYKIFRVIKKHRLMDEQYITKIEEDIGRYYTGIVNNNAFFDSQTIINYIYSRESKSGMSKKKIEDFILYCICLTMSEHREDGYYINKMVVEDNSFDSEKIPEKAFELKPIPKEIKNIKLEYINFETIKENLESLKELCTDEVSIQIVQNLIEYIE